MTSAVSSIKKIRKFRLRARPSAVLRNLKLLLENAQTTPELDKDIETESAAALALLETAALFVTVPRGQAPDWSEALWAPLEGHPAPVALTFFTVTIGPGLEGELAGALSRGEGFRSRVLTALGEELADQGASFVERLVAEEALQDSCELLDRRTFTDDGMGRSALGFLDAGRIGVGYDVGGHRAPRFTRVGVIPWGPPSKKRK